MKILIIDDDKNITEAILISFQLQWQEVQVITAPNGEIGLDLFYEQNPDLILLDVMMPYKDGFSVLKEIRQTDDVPIIMLTARSDDMSIIKALESGADDYLSKPFSHLELFARIKAVMRRTRLPAPNNSTTPFTSGGLIIDFGNRQVTKNGQNVKLTPTEYKLLFLMARNAGRALTFENLLDKVWGPEYRDQLDYLKTYMSRLRKKLEDKPDEPQFLLTERGFGYRLNSLPKTATLSA